LRPSFGALAQLGERNTGSVEVSGSIPLGSTKFLPHKALFLQGFLLSGTSLFHWLFFGQKAVCGLCAETHFSFPALRLFSAACHSRLAAK
jgi:hypothetical protein